MTWQPHKSDGGDRKDRSSRTPPRPNRTRPASPRPVWAAAAPAVLSPATVKGAPFAPMLLAVTTAVAAICIGPTFAHASPPEGVPYTLSYEAPAGCPTRAELSAEVLSRLNRDPTRVAPTGPKPLSDPIRATPSDPDPRVVELRIDIHESPLGFVAELRVARQYDHPMVRQVTAPDCAQAAVGIALVTALAIESQLRPAASTPGAPPQPSQAVGSEPAATDRPPPNHGFEAQSISKAEPRQQKNHLRANGIRLARRDSPRRSGKRGEYGPVRALGLLVLARTGAGPRLTPGLGFEGRMAPRPEWPALRLAIVGLDTFPVEKAGAEVRFRNAIAEAGICDNRPFPSPELRVQPCAGLELGLLSAQGSADDERLVREHRVDRLWAAAVLGLWFRAEFERSFVEAGIDGRLPLLRHHYVFTNPHARVYDVPTVAAGAALGTGLRF